MSCRESVHPNPCVQELVGQENLGKTGCSHTMSNGPVWWQESGESGLIQFLIFVKVFFKVVDTSGKFLGNDGYNVHKRNMPPTLIIFKAAASTFSGWLHSTHLVTMPQ